MMSKYESMDNETNLEKLKRLFEKDSRAERVYTKLATQLMHKINKSKETQEEPEGLSYLACLQDEACR